MTTRLILSELLICISFYSACGRPLSLSESERSDRVLPFYQAETTPIIAVGRIMHNTEIGHPYSSKWRPHSQVQLYKATVTVENVLRGERIPENLDVYYIADTGPFGGPPRLGVAENGGTWHIGDREIFFLRRDSGVLRTICDYMHFCVVPVMTGSHPGFKLDLSKPVAYGIVDLLLTKGQGISDAEMANAIVKSPADSFSKDYTLQKLQQLTLSGSPEIHNAACEMLAALRHPCPVSRS